MCHGEVMEWFVNLVANNPDEFKNKRVLEIGSKYVNGSVRPIIEKFGSPKEYVGTDIEKGKFVDLVLPAEKIVEQFGENSFDAIISTELLEHVKDWRIVIDNMKTVLRIGGTIYLTTRSYGFKYHGYPCDYWRYEKSDIEKIFSDFKICELFEDHPAPGIFLKAKKTSNQKIGLNDMSLYSIAIGKRTSNTPELALKRKIMLGLRKYRLLKTVI